MLNSAQMHIAGMNSAESTRKVSDALVRVQGVADIGVNPDQGLVEVRFDAGKTNEAALQAAVREAGFQVQ